MASAIFIDFQLFYFLIRTIPINRNKSDRVDEVTAY